MNDTSAAPPPRHQRRRHVVDARMQWGIALRVLIPVIGISVLYAVAVLLFLSRSDVTILHAADLRRFLLLASAIYTLLSAGVLIVVALILTHRVAGPAMVIEHALDGMLEGDSHRRLSLRGYDYLERVAARLITVREHLRREREDVREALDRLDEHLANGDADEAAEIVARLRRSSAASPLATRDANAQERATAPRAAATCAP